MAMNVIHTIAPGATIPSGYFDFDNINFIQSKVVEVLSREFIQQIVIDHASIIRVMQRVLEERREVIPRMNQRVIMYLCSEFRNHQHSVNRTLNWEDGYISSQRNVDKVGNMTRFDMRGIKTKDQKKYDGKSRVGGTLRFYFT